jgi:hypothetical protein
MHCLRYSTASVVSTMGLLWGCLDSTPATSPTQAPATLNYTNGPQAPNAIVFRGTFGALAFSGDPDNTLALAINFLPSASAQDICNDPLAAVNFAEGSGQVIFTPSGRYPLTTVGHGLYTAVYAYGKDPLTDFCQLVGAPIVGTGTSDVTSNVSNVGDGSFAEYTEINGTIDLTAGGTARLHAIQQFTVRPDGTVVNDWARITLTPL